MTTLPPIIAHYLQAKQAHDVEAILGTLSADAVITDEGRTYTGADAIRRWNANVSDAVHADYEVTDAAPVGDRVAVAVEVRGEFPGSPVTLYFLFTVAAEKITALTIVP